MVNILAGPMGSGKTQQMIALANEQVKECNGNVVFVKKTHRETASVAFNIRTICMDDFPAIKNMDGYLGFLYGMYSCNTDTQCVFIDGLTKQANISLENIAEFFPQLEKLSADCGIDFYVSISAEKKEVEYLINDQCQFVA